MDTKLKNNRWGSLGAALVILGAAAGLMAVYPWLGMQVYEGSSDAVGYIVEQGEYSGYNTIIGAEMDPISRNWRIQQIVAWLILGIGMLVSLLAFSVALIKPLGMTSKKLFRTPFEVVLFVCYLSAFFILRYIDSGFILYSLTGELQTMFMEELYLGKNQAEAAVWILNFLIWAAGAFILYWSVTCLTGVFHMGVLRYIKERTLIGWLCLWCAGLFKNTHTLIESVDFREKSTKMLLKIVGINFLLLLIINFFWFVGIFGLIIYSVVLFFLLREIYTGMQKKYKVLLRATNELAEGNLDVEIKEPLGVFEPFRGEIEKIQSGFKKAVEEEVKSQSMKTELITNVSHDLKTPLTAIITYVDLLKKEDITAEERAGYIQVLDQKSIRLKHLIEDLFEVSKANSKNVTLNLMEVDIVSLMKQVRLELDDMIQESRVDFKWGLPSKRIAVNLDSERTYRIFENLLINIVKYSMPGTRAYVDIEEKEGEVIVSMKNISATEISLNGAELSDRFVRGDVSRGTEGSGLGLAIAKSFVELQKGRFEVVVEADLFKVLITWKEET